MINETFKRRFTELHAEMPRSMPPDPDTGTPYYTADYYLGWATSAQDLIRAVFGDASPQHDNFVTALTASTISSVKFESLKSIFRSAKEVFDGGFVFNVELTVSGEVFGDFVMMAKQAQSAGHKNVAAVLACAALEDALKRYAIANGLTVDDNSMQDTVNALKSKGIVTGAQKSLLDPMPKIRDYAMHANWDKITEQDVGAVLGYVEQFLLTKFSGNA